MYVRIFSVLFVAAILTLSFTACDEVEGSSGDQVTLTIEPRANEMKFQEERLTVNAGDEVRRVFDNTATALSIAHNVVILNTNDSDEADRIGNESIAAGSANDYVPDDPMILASTPVAQAGESVEITFSAPSTPGEYIYFCTYPGYHSMMRGVLIVE